MAPVYSKAMEKRPKQSKITPAKVDAIARLIAAGNYKRTAAGAAGISDDTFTNWVTRGTADLAAGRQTLYAELSGRINKAETDAETRLLAIVRKAAQGGSIIKTTTRTPGPG